MLTICVLVAALLSAPDYNALINQWLSDDQTLAGTAYKEILAAGADAIPALVNRLDDPTEIHNGIFQAPLFRRLPNGEEELVTPTVGDTAFTALRVMIEGRRVKSVQGTYFLTKENAREWIKALANTSLRDMQLRAVSDSIKRQMVEIKVRGWQPNDQHNLHCLSSRLEELTSPEKSLP
ncbi:MAG: hypothetical protein C0478_05940 [Planctomyces sp.]|nr:hypothetical protein [Planctomyces sp.]